MGMNEGRKIKKKVGTMWAGVQIYACFVTAWVYEGFLQRKLTEIILPSVRRPNKTKSESLKHPHARPSATEMQPELSGHQRLHAMGNPYEDVLFFLHRRHALARHISSLSRPASVVCLLTCRCGAELLWNEICALKHGPVVPEMQTLFLMLILQAWALSDLSITRGNVK